MSPTTLMPTAMSSQSAQNPNQLEQKILSLLQLELELCRLALVKNLENRRFSQIQSGGKKPSGANSTGRGVFAPVGSVISADMAKDRINTAYVLRQFILSFGLSAAL